jgi:hypothetical protein
MHGGEHLQCQAESAPNWSDSDPAKILYKDLDDLSQQLRKLQ